MNVLSKVIRTKHGELVYSVIDFKKNKFSLPPCVEFFKQKYDKIVYLELLECDKKRQGFGSELLSMLRKKTDLPIVVQAGFINMSDWLS